MKIINGRSFVRHRSVEEQKIDLKLHRGFLSFLLMTKYTLFFFYWIQFSANLMMDRLYRTIRNLSSNGFLRFRLSFRRINASLLLCQSRLSQHTKYIANFSVVYRSFQERRRSNYLPNCFFLSNHFQFSWFPFLFSLSTRNITRSTNFCYL